MKLEERALPWFLFCVTAIALTVVLMNFHAYQDSAVRADRWQAIEAQAAEEGRIRKFYQDQIDRLEDRIEQLEAELAARK